MHRHEAAGVAIWVAVDIWAASVATSAASPVLLAASAPRAWALELEPALSPCVTWAIVLATPGPAMAEAFTKKAFTALVSAVRLSATLRRIAAGSRTAAKPLRLHAFAVRTADPAQCEVSRSFVGSAVLNANLVS